MKVKQYMLNFLNIFKKKEKRKASVYLNENISRFIYLSCAISESSIDIIPAEDLIGGYYEKKLILPKSINIFNKKSKNTLCYIYRIIFSLTSKKLNFYLPKDKKNIDYILLASIITVKTIHKHMNNLYPNSKKLIKNIFINKQTNFESLKNLTGRELLLKIIIKKIKYKKIRDNIYLNNDEKFWLYQIENIKKLKQNNFKITLQKIYDNLCNTHKKYKNIEFDQLWGYMYFKKKKIYTSIKEKIENIKKYKNKITSKQNIITQKNKIKSDKEKKNILNSIFNYTKTIDNYKNSNKHSEDSSQEDLYVLKNIKINNITQNKIKTTSLFSSNIINNIYKKNLEKKTIKTKKFTYQEWDFNIKKYKKNWCNVFSKKINDKQITYEDRNIIENIINKNKKEIMLLNKNFFSMINEKTWIKRQLHGQDIDLDSVIDNYKYTETHSCDFNKIYKYKKKTNRNIAISILLDSSLSTDGYIKNEKIINTLKKLTLLISCGIHNLIKNLSVSTFYSNTRLDCKHIIIKNFKDNWNKAKYNIIKIKPSGYTRIGPALRHLIYKFKKIKAKQKIILLLTDGKPIDYDEYEGSYGINDVKHAVNEANLKKIYVKSIILNNTLESYFSRMFGSKNYELIHTNQKIYNQIIKTFRNIIK